MHSVLFIDSLHTPVRVHIMQDHLQKTLLFEEDTPDFMSLFTQKISPLIEQFQIKELWCIVGPGPFTRMRIITLTLNTLLFVYDDLIGKSCHFFDTIDTRKGIPILEANKNEYLVRLDKKDIFIPKSDLGAGKYLGYFGKNNFTDGITFVQYSLDLPFLETIFSPLVPTKLFVPLYIKPPHITLCSPDTSR